jgi:protoheme IX farnesyltransferase
MIGTMTFKARFKAYYYLTKPGIIRGNLLTALAGFLLASRGSVNFVTAIATLLGLGFVIGSACVTNNYLDIGLDKRMARTAKRALVTGKITGTNALMFAGALLLAGVLLLGLFVNAISLLFALFGWFAYVVVYGYFKRRTTLGTAVGSISGAIPPVVGYVAVTGRLDTAALLLFLILTFWQMPHFFSIAMFRAQDYTAAGLPVLPVKKGFKNTKIQCLIYIMAYTVASILLTVYGYTGKIYIIFMLLAGGYWLFRALQGFRAKDDIAWARKLFFTSLIVLTAQCVLIGANQFLV